MKTAHRDVLITIGVASVIVLICQFAIFGLPSDKSESRLDNLETITVDTIQNEVPLLDIDVDIPVSVPIDENDADSSVTQVQSDSI